MTISLQFPLDVEDDWPPIGSESLPFKEVTDGLEAEVPPLFVKDIAVGDVINVTKRDEEGMIRTWNHVKRSDHSTVWLLRMGGYDDIGSCLEKARSIGCNTSTMDEFGCYAIDVPSSVAISDIDEILAALDKESVAIAFPAMRHPD